MRERHHRGQHRGYRRAGHRDAKAHLPGNAGRTSGPDSRRSQGCPGRAGEKGTGPGQHASQEYNKADGQVWAATPGFEVTPEEAQVLIAAMPKTNADSPLFETGVILAGEKYLCVSHDSTGVYGRIAKTGVVCLETSQAIIIAHHPETVGRPVATKTVAALADYLKGVGY
ncbi:profilin [Streptomyces sp. NPDC002073]